MYFFTSKPIKSPFQSPFLPFFPSNFPPNHFKLKNFNEIQAYLWAQSLLFIFLSVWSALSSIPQHCIWRSGDDRESFTAWLLSPVPKVLSLSNRLWVTSFPFNFNNFPRRWRRRRKTLLNSQVLFQTMSGKKKLFWNAILHSAKTFSTIAENFDEMTTSVTEKNLSIPIGFIADSLEMVELDVNFGNLVHLVDS